MIQTYGQLEPLVPDRADWTLPTLLAMRRRTHGDKVFLHVPEERFSASFEEMHAAAHRVAVALIARGGAPGERVVILAANGSAYVQAWFGCSMAGMVEAPINTAYIGSFLDHQIDLAQPAFVMVAPDLASRIARSEAARRWVRRVFVFGDGAARDDAAAQLRSAGLEVESFAALLDEQGARELPEVQPHQAASVLFTSGTTGPSKGVLMSHTQMHGFAETVRHGTSLGEADVLMAPAPLFHGNSQFCGVLVALLAGSEVVIRRKFSASSWLDWLREYGVTATNLIGVMTDFIWRQPETPHDADNSLRSVLAIPTPPSLVEPFKKRFGIEAFCEGFGLTETGLPIMTPYGAERPPGAVGLLVDEWFEVRLADPVTDEEVPIGEPGEFLVRPKHPGLSSMGYLGMPDKTAEAFRNLWFHTGDALRRDEDGWYYFVDRIKDALRRRGENISSFEVERPISQHPGVAAVAVVAVASDIDGGEDEVMAVVQRVEGTAVTAEDIWAWSDERIPSFAVPRYIRFVDELPTTPTEKLRKDLLRTEGVTPDTQDRTTVASSSK